MFFSSRKTPHISSSLKFALVIFLSLLLFYDSTNISAQKTYYIDPGYSGTIKTGNQKTPFTSFKDFNFQSNSTYRIKRSARMEVDSTIIITEDYVILGAYGEGDRPVIKSMVDEGARVLVVRGNYCKVEDIEFIAEDRGPDNSAGVVIDIIGARNARLVNVKTQGGNRGINSSKTVGTTTIVRCQVEGTWDDGMYHRENEAIIIDECEIQRVNLKYLLNPDQKYAGGDCIQFDFVDYFEVKNCFIDKTFTGGKFSLIADHFGFGLAENNRFILSDVQHGIYLGIGESFIFRYNYLSGGQYGIWNKTAEVEMAYNIIKNTDISGYYGGDRTKSKLYNNLFHNNKVGIFGWMETMNVHNNIFYFNEADIEGNTEIIYSDYNCFYPATDALTGPNSFFADPLFLDPEKELYILDPLSPCIDAGVDVGKVSTDINYYSDAYGLNPDLGPMEYFDGPYPDSRPGNVFRPYPVPSSGTINLFFKGEYYLQAETIRIADQTGEILYQQDIDPDSPRIKIPFHIYESGIYFVQVIYKNGGSSSRKFIIEN